MNNHYQISIDLSKFTHAKMSVKGKSGKMVQGIFLPIDQNNLKLMDTGAVYANFIAFENKEVKYDNTHSIKQSLSKEVAEKMTDEEKKAMPYFGNMKPAGRKEEKQIETSESNDFVDQDSMTSDDLPF